MSNMEEAKAAAEAAVQEHFVLRKEQTERIRKARAGGVKGELSSTTLPRRPTQEPSHAPMLTREEEGGGGGRGGVVTYSRGGCHVKPGGGLHEGDEVGGFSF